jgi:hypothetical protein
MARRELLFVDAVVGANNFIGDGVYRAPSVSHPEPESPAAQRTAEENKADPSGLKG